MDWLNPVEWAAWLYGKLFQGHEFAGGAVVTVFCALVGFLVWVRGVDKFREDHPHPKPQAAVETRTTNISLSSPRPAAAAQVKREHRSQLQPCDTTAVINNCNSPRTTIDHANIHATAPALNNEHSPDTHIGTLDYNVPGAVDQPFRLANGPRADIAPSKEFVDCSKNPAALEFCNAGRNAMTGNTVFGCGPAVKADNAPGSTIDGTTAYTMPADACFFYYGALRLQPDCYQRNKLSPSAPADELKQTLVKWETGVSRFWTGDNQRKWSLKFGNEDPTSMSLDTLCADIETNSPKMAFFRVTYYGFDPYQSVP